MRQAVLLLGLLALAACGASDRHRTVALLQQRMHAQLASATAAGAVTQQNLPDGVRLVFADNAPPLDPSPRTRMAEALIEPALLRIGIQPPSTLPPDQANDQVQDWTDALARMQVGDALRPPTIQAAEPVPSGTTVTIQVVCPHRSNGWGYGDGTRAPGCF